MEEELKEVDVISDEGGQRVVGGSNVCDDVMNKGAGDDDNDDDDDDDDLENQLIHRRRTHFPSPLDDLTSSTSFTATNLPRTHFPSPLDDLTSSTSFTATNLPSRETNVTLNSGRHALAAEDPRFQFSPKIAVTWIMGAVVGLPVAHDLLIRHLGDRSKDFQSNHKIVEGLSVMSLWAVIVFGVLLSLVFAFPTFRSRAMCLWFPSACFGFLMCFSVLIMIVEFFLVLRVMLL